MTHSPPKAIATYSSILVPMDLQATAPNRAKLAFGIADRFSSRVIGLAAEPIQAPMYYETPVSGIQSIVQIEEARCAKELRDAEELFRKIAGARNNHEWRQAITWPTAFTCEQSRAADLIILGQPQSTEPGSNPLEPDGGDVVMEAGRPVLFAPAGCDYVSGKRVVIGWKDTRESRRAVLDSLPFLKVADEVFIVTTDSNWTGALDVKAYLAGHGVAAMTINRRAGDDTIADELLNTVRGEGADLLVTGAYGHSRFKEWIFGGVTQHLLHRAKICCLMSH